MKSLKKTILACILLTVFALAFAHLTSADSVSDGKPTATDGAKTINEENFDDALEAKGDTRLYRFEMEDTGDAVILFRSKMKYASGYSHNWSASVYSADMEPIVENRKLAGFKDLTVINVKALEAGEYYVHIKETHFNKSHYDIAVVRCYASAVTSFENDGVQIFDGTNQIIGEIAGTYFIKVGEGRSYGVFHRNEKGALLPLLVSEDKNAVSYAVSTTEEVSESASGNYSTSYGGKTYYYSATNFLEKYTDKKATDAPYHMISSDVNNLMKHIFKQLEIQEKGKLMYIVSNFWYWPLVIIAIIGAAILCGFMWGGGVSSDSDSDVPSSSGGSGGISLRESEEMDIIQRVSSKINSPDYDVAGFDKDDLSRGD